MINFLLLDIDAVKQIYLAAKNTDLYMCQVYIYVQTHTHIYSFNILL